MSSGIRFAPSPTGRFHLGNLRTAWIAQWWARELGQKLVIRSEDIDFPRNILGAHEQQMRDLEKIGIKPDAIMHQSDRRNRHWEVFIRALAEEVVYPCTCSRKEVRLALDALASAPHGSAPVYDGHCRNRGASDHGQVTGIAWRFRNLDESGAQDFIVARTQALKPDLDSFIPSYHWACAIDDSDGNYTLIVRAWDLESSVPLQRNIQTWLQIQNYSYSGIYHTSLVTQNDGQRLEKRTRGVTLDELAACGISGTDLGATFASSFHASKSEYQISRIWGEPARTIKLAELI